MSQLESLRLFLSQFFNQQQYSAAIVSARERVASDATYREAWRGVRALIRERGLPTGQPLALVNHAANQMLDENTDAEAYRWLDLMVDNVDRADAGLTEY